MGDVVFGNAIAADQFIQRWKRGQDLQAAERIPPFPAMKRLLTARVAGMAKLNFSS